METTPEQRQQRMKEFMQVLPLTVEIAGLAKGHFDQMFSADQMEVRTMNLKSAYKLARKLLREVSEEA